MTRQKIVAHTTQDVRGRSQTSEQEQGFSTRCLIHVTRIVFFLTSETFMLAENRYEGQ